MRNGKGIYKRRRFDLIYKKRGRRMLNKRRKDTTEKSQIPKKRLYERYLLLKRKYVKAYFTHTSKSFLQNFKSIKNQKNISDLSVSSKFRNNGLEFKFFFI